MGCSRRAVPGRAVRGSDRDDKVTLDLIPFQYGPDPQAN